MSADHNERVNSISRQITSFYDAKKSFYIYHGSSNSTRAVRYKKDEIVDISLLRRVIAIDAARQTAWVEPNVSMDELLHATLAHGLMPAVVMEFPGITVGGAIQGGAGESSSFKYGCFNEICTSYEVILSDGSVVTASPTENADLFYGIPGTYGSIGVLTAAAITLVPAKQYVELQYQAVSSFAEMITALAHNDDCDFIDGLMFSASHGTVIKGKLVDHPASEIQRFSRAQDPWFYLHAQAASQSVSVPLQDYLFRYDRGAFWMGKYPFSTYHVPFNPVTRYSLNPLMKTRTLYRALQNSGGSNKHLVQDMAVPEQNAVSLLSKLDAAVGVYPLWICPFKGHAQSQFLPNALQSDRVINVGVWGGPAFSDTADFINTNRAIEAMLANEGGKKWLYAPAYYSKQEFWKVYNKTPYALLREKYRASALKDIYTKVSAQPPPKNNRIKGIVRTLTGKNGLLD